MRWKEGRINYHYNDAGIKILAKEIKKGLYSTANVQNKQLTQILVSSKPRAVPMRQQCHQCYQCQKDIVCIE